MQWVFTLTLCVFCWDVKEPYGLGTFLRTIHGWGEEVKLMVIDGQGGGIGATIIKGLRQSIGN